MVFLSAVPWTRNALSQTFGKDPPTLPTAEPPYYRVRYAASEVEGELRYAVSYTVWVPPGVKTLRGLIVHQHGCGEGACRAGQTAAFDLHWQELAAAHDCALLGPSYEQPEGADCQLWCDPRHGSDKKFLQALKELSVTSGHTELETVPWALWGHSGGACWVGSMLMLHPERCAAVWMRSGIPNIFPREGINLPTLKIPDAALVVPSMCNLGTQEGVTVKDGRFAGVWPRVEELFKVMRDRGALIGVSVDPLSSHDCGNQRYLAIAWFDTCLRARLPENAGGSMKAMVLKDAHWAKLDGTSFEASQSFTGDAAKMSYLPNQVVAEKWLQYSNDSQVADTTPPPAPTAIKLNGSTLTWSCRADLESGLTAFVVMRGGKEVGRLPAQPHKNIGRSNFQKNSYSDTPSQPLAEMRFEVADAAGAKVEDFQVIAINTVGLRSDATSR
ncbi:MAG: hypothetical protein U0892_14800 [Pirellulales bacterium]